MKKLLGALTVLGLAAAAAWGQPGTYRIYTHPRLPSGEALDRMGLKLAWSGRLVLRGDRDGFSSVQLIPGTEGTQVLVQTYSGVVALWDGETGDLRWQAQVGKEFRTSQPPAFNSNSIFVIRHHLLAVLNRNTGMHRAYTVDTFSGL